MLPGSRAERYLGYQQITSLSSAVGFTIPEGTAYAEVAVSGQAIRWRADGTNPTATVGMPILANAGEIFSLAQLSAVRFIEQAPSATLDITYYG